MKPLFSFSIPRRPFLRLVRAVEQLASDYHALNRGQLERLAEIERTKQAARRGGKDFGVQDDRKVFAREQENARRRLAGEKELEEVTR